VSDTPSIPQGWAWTPLGKIVEAIEATDPKQNPEVEITYFDIGSINNEAGIVDAPKVLQGKDAPSRARQVVRPDDVLFSTVRPYLKAIAQVPPRIENGIASTGFCVLRGVSGVLSRYLYFRVRSDQFLHDLLPLQRGVSYPAVRDKDILGQVIPLAPTKEQTRIVEKLEELFSDLDAGVAELKAAQKKLAQYRQALLKAAVEGALTAAWRTRRAEQGSPVETGAQLLTRILAERRRRWEEKQLAKFAEQGKTPPQDWQAKYPEPVPPDTSDLPELPEGWTWASVDQLSFEIRNGYALKPNAESGVPILRISAVRPLALNLADLRFLSGVSQDYAEFLVEKGDLLFTRYNGTVSLVGVCAVVPEITGSIVHPDKLIRARINSDFASPNFVSIAANTNASRSFLESRIRTTAGQAGISGGDVKETPIPLAPMLEQEQIANIVETQLSAVTNAAADIEAKLKSAQALRQVILRQAFSGQLVAQDPNDEPARVLLERIRAARAERAQQPKPRKAKASQQAEREPLFAVAEARDSSPQRGG
jgi:type I restriction enzyme S subunit